MRNLLIFLISLWIIIVSMITADAIAERMKPCYPFLVTLIVTMAVSSFVCLVLSMALLS